MYRIQKEQSNGGAEGEEGGKIVLRFHGNCLSATEIHKTTR